MLSCGLKFDATGRGKDGTVVLDVRPPQSFAHAGKVRHAYHRHHSARLAARLATRSAARLAARLSLLQARL